MKKKSIIKNSTVVFDSLEDIKPEPLSTTVKTMQDKDIDLDDNPEMAKKFWENAKVVMPKGKKQVTLRVDAEVLDWFKKSGKGWQTRMNAVLSSYVKAQ